jgi:hypothetical protein
MEGMALLAGRVDVTLIGQPFVLRTRGFADERGEIAQGSADALGEEGVDLGSQQENDCKIVEESQPVLT